MTAYCFYYKLMGERNFSMDYSKLMYRLVCTVSQSGKRDKEIPVLPQAYSEHRFSDHFIYGYRDFYVDVYEKESCMPILDVHTFSEVVEYQQKWFLVRISQLWGVYDFKGNLVCEVIFSSQNDAIGHLLSNLN